MKKLLNLMMAAALICGASVFTSCTKQDNPVGPPPVDNLAEKIIGKWINAEKNKQPIPTNKKSVFTFISATKAYMSTSSTPNPSLPTLWNDYTEIDVVIDGNKMTLTMQPDEQVKVVDEYTVLAIDATEFIANLKATIIIDGIVVISEESIARFTKVKAEYKEDILGTWEGHVTNSEGSVYDDGETHRWEYKADGTYVYYVKDGDDWVPYATTTLNEYFVDGVLLCTRWIDNDVENREWWEIASIKDGVMKWNALRQKEDGSTYTATFEMKKVQ